MECRAIVCEGGRRGRLGAVRNSNVRRCRGIALAWTAIVLFVMILMVGLSIDWGKLVWNANEMQNAADAAALAGAQIVRRGDPNAAIQRAYDFGLKNYADRLQVALDKGDGEDIVVGRWVRQNREFVATADSPDAVRVNVRRQDGLGEERPALSMVFGPMVGTNTVGAAREAIAWCFQGTGAALICLDPSPPNAKPGLKIWGDAYVDVENGGIHVNADPSNDRPATMVGGSAYVDCEQLNSVGTTQPDPFTENAWDKYSSTSFSVNTRDTSGVEPIEDPVAAVMGFNELDLPRDAAGNLIYGTVQYPDGTTVGAQSIAGPVKNSCTLGPGYYPGGISTEDGPTIVMDPTLGWDASKGQAVYFLGGAGLQSNNGTLTGHGVTIYVTQDKTAVLDLGGNVILDITSPGDAAGTEVDGMPGIALWVDPDNTNTVRLRGCPGEGVQGTMYFPNSFVDCRGTPGKGAPQIICGSMDISGNVSVGVNYDERNGGYRPFISYIVR